MSPVRVVHVVVAGEIGGAERMLVDLASRPRETDATHAIALMTPNAALAALFERAGLRVLDRGRVREDPFSYLWRSLGPTDTRWLEGALRGERAEVAQLHTFGSHVVGTRAALRAGARVLRTEHAADAYLDPSCWPFSRWSLARAAAVVCVSRHVRAVAVEKAPDVAARVRVIMNGVDTERFALAPLPAAEPFTFAIVARLERAKGVDLALDALALVPGAALVVVGDGSERAKLEAHARARCVASRTRFVGFAEDPRPHLAAAHVALSSSRSEGLGIALLEAMSMGRAVCAMPTGGVPEIVRAGETGWLAAERTPEALAACMREATAPGEAEARGRSARAFVLREASVTAMCAAYREVYASLRR